MLQVDACIADCQTNLEDSSIKNRSNNLKDLFSVCTKQKDDTQKLLNKIKKLTKV